MTTGSPLNRVRDRCEALTPDAEGEIQALVEEFLARLQAGEQPEPSDVILAHPDLASELEQRLEALELLHTLVGASREDGAGTGPPTEVRSIGRYVIRDKLGAGAFAVVYRAYDPKFDREVALKVVRAVPTAGGNSADRFERDARLAAQLRHPHIVPLHDAGEQDGLRYLDMELISGESLEARLQRRPGQPLDFREAVTLVHKVAGALDYAHRAGIVHRDVKPGNILLDARGEPQLTDFGLARDTERDRTLTLAGQILGTPAYMSPEQADGRAHQADRRSDVYSIGVVLYRLLTGRLPFADTGSLATLLAHIARDEPPRPRTVNPAVPRDLETICLKALEKDPRDRFAMAGAFADELRRWLHDEPLTVRPPSVGERARRWARRNQAITWVSAVAAVLVLAVGGILGWTALAQRQQADEARLRESLEAEKRAEIEVHVLLERARQRLRAPGWGRRFEAQDFLRQAGAPRRKIPPGEVADALDREIRSVFAATLAVPDMHTDGDKVILGGNFYAPWRAALRPDGELMAIGTPVGPIRWVHGQRPTVPKMETDRPRPRLAYSPDGKYLAFAPAEGGLTLWDGDVTRRLKQLEPAGAGVVLAVGFAAGVPALWACHADGRLRAWSLPDGRIATDTVLPPEPPEPLTAAAFDATVTRLAVGDGRGVVRLHALHGDRMPELPPAEIDVEALAWSPDGRLLAVGTTEGNVQLWHADGRPSHSFAGLPSGVGNLCFHPSGRWILAGGRNDSLMMWDVATGERVLTGSQVPWGFDGQGRRLAGSYGYGAAFWELHLPEVIRPLTGHRAALAQVAWARGGRYLASWDEGYHVRVWNLERGVAVDEFLGPKGYYAMNAAVALSDGGGLLAFASSGDDARFVLRDVASHRDVGAWRLPAGFDRMTYARGRFLLVREERDAVTRANPRSVVYELLPGRPLQRVGTLRRSRPDEMAFYRSGLTPDGRFFWWSGPRHPPAQARVEVYEIATGRQTRQIATPATDAVQAETGTADANGHWLWTRTIDGHCMRCDVAGRGPVEEVRVYPTAASPDSHWLVLARPHWEAGSFYPLSLWRLGPEQAWLQLRGGDPSPALVQSFSPDGRYLALGDQDGVLLLVDLPALVKAVAAFEQSLRAE